MRSGGGEAPKGRPKNIGEALSDAERKKLGDIFDEKADLSGLSKEARERVAQVFEDVAKKNPAGSLQRAFQEARAKFVRGEGPNPGRNPRAFAEKHGLPINRRGGG